MKFPLALSSFLVASVLAGGAELLDPAFRAQSPPILRGPDGPVLAIAADGNEGTDGASVVIAGDFARVNGVPRNGIAMLGPDGTLDARFDAGIGPDGPIRSLAALAGGGWRLFPVGS